MEKTNEIKSSSIQISFEKCNEKIYDLIELIFTGFVDVYYLCSNLTLINGRISISSELPKAGLTRVDCIKSAKA
ncbi:hypothetical protein BpHYR1_008323 [Brachionus plicatilis]|uniref:Uncharacterized protein n=1 Tax=Brachionus plicatilis TaxID=10195 RepID=A0A3M7QMN8_BRAPC|nr:hypothetical protein BpHYR1_008323 [Brachionus plicatilis]